MQQGRQGDDDVCVSRAPGDGDLPDLSEEKIFTHNYAQFSWCAVCAGALRAALDGGLAIRDLNSRSPATFWHCSDAPLLCSGEPRLRTFIMATSSTGRDAGLGNVANDPAAQLEQFKLLLKRSRERTVLHRRPLQTMYHFLMVGLDYAAR